MKKLILIATVVLFALSLGFAIAANMPKGDIAVDSGNGKKTAVTFSHAKHQAKDIKCDACHHQVDGKDNTEKCGSCHTLGGGDAPKLKDALHGKKGPGKCYTCHLLKGAEKKLKCGDCHTK